jgi:hypothetical protein
MNKQITINSITGSQPYDVWICDDNYNGCVYIQRVGNIDIPFTFIVPTPFSSLIEVGIKVYDSNNCEIKNKVNL